MEGRCSPRQVHQDCPETKGHNPTRRTGQTQPEVAEMKYKVKITRISYASQTIEIQAEDEDEAKLKAQDETTNLDFSEDDYSHEYEVIK